MNFPSELVELDHWLVWRAKKINGRLTKVPYRADRPSIKASTTNSSTWTPYEVALETLNTDHVSGIGWVFDDSDPMCGIDFDGVKDADGKVKPGILQFVKKLGTYAEWSPSGNGIHVIGKATLDKGHKTDRNTKLGCKLEIYDKGRYFTMTGRKVRGATARIKPFNPTPVLALMEKQIEVKGDATDIGEASRHDQIIVAGRKAVQDGLNEEQVKRYLESLARVIGLPEERWPDDIYRYMRDDLFSHKSKSTRVARATDNLEVQHEARLAFEQRLGGGIEDLTLIPTDAELELPDSPEVFAVDELHTEGGNTILTAMHKAGKTSLMMSLCKALVDGEPFLGAFPTKLEEGSSVVYFNYELTQDLWRRTIRKLGVGHSDRLYTSHRRGLRLPFWLPGCQSDVIEGLKRAEASWWVIDPQVAAYEGMVDNENDNMQTQAFFSCIDEIKHKSGVNNVVIVNHMGRISEGKDYGHARGASRIEGWSDHNWQMTMEHERAPRSLRAFGRGGVDVAPIELQFDNARGLYSWDGATRSQSRGEVELTHFLQQAVAYHASMGEWPLKGELWQNVRRYGPRRCINAAVKFNYMEVDEHKGRQGAAAQHHVVTQAGRDYIESHTM